VVSSCPKETRAPKQKTSAVQRNFLGAVSRTAQGVFPDTQA
jgi:hypothetical protein